MGRPDHLNREQRSAVNYCAEHGHHWETIGGREYCASCGWPRDGVCAHAGGTSPRPCYMCDGPRATTVTEKDSKR
jgi:hypothetical protein